MDRKSFGYVPPKASAYAKKPEPAKHIPELAWKFCECSCGRRFRVPETSRARFASRACAEKMKAEYP